MCLRPFGSLATQEKAFQTFDKKFSKLWTSIRHPFLKTEAVSQQCNDLDNFCHFLVSTYNQFFFAFHALFKFMIFSPERSDKRHKFASVQIYIFYFKS
jgi:hypothetical protein